MSILYLINLYCGEFELEMAEKLEDSLQQASQLVKAGDWNGAATLLETLKAAHPLSPVVARLWCSLAKRTGQMEKVPAYAADIYEQMKDDVHLARWSHVMGSANFALLDLISAKDNFSRALAHLIALTKAGKVPRKREQSAIQSDIAKQLFVSGQAEQLLWKTCAELASHDIRAFPFAGTLLGLVREGRLLEFDKDLDIAIWAESLDECSLALEDMGWSRVSTSIEYSNYRDYVHTEIGISLDVCALAHVNAQKIVGGFSLPGHSAAYQRVSVFPIFDLTQRETEFGMVWFPQQPEKILSAFYGDWRTPNPYWDTVISALNLEQYTLLVQCYAYHRLAKSWLAGDLIKAWSYTQQIALKDMDDVLILRCRQWLEKTMLQLGQEIPIWPHNHSKRRVYTRMVGDLFHAGHVNFLRAARALGSHLTVCVVSDERVQENKGKSPVMTQAERVAVVSACQYVDTVITESPVNATLQFMQAHGFDVYTFACASENERVEKYKQCALLPTHLINELKYTPNISTTELVKRVLDGASGAVSGPVD